MLIARMYGHMTVMGHHSHETHTRALTGGDQAADRTQPPQCRTQINGGPDRAHLRRIPSANHQGIS